MMHRQGLHLDPLESTHSSREARTHRALGPHMAVGLAMRSILFSEMENSVAARIVQTSFLMFLGYLVIGLLLAILPSFVHLRLGLTPVWAGIVVGTQYASTLLTRPRAGLMTDLTGPKATVLSGQAAFLVSGSLLLISAFLQHRVALCISVLLLSRVVLGYGESSVATGTITWGLGRVGPENATQVISWSGIASYSAMALGAPLGIWIERLYGFAAIGATVLAISFLNLIFASFIAGVPVVGGTRIGFSKLLLRVLPMGLGLAFGTVGFGVIASFLTLYFARQHWSDPAIALVLFGIGFVVTRLLLANTIDRWGGFRLAIVSLFVEFAGLFALWMATTQDTAMAATTLSGCGFALVFPALGVEVVREVSGQDRGVALGVYTAFLDLAMGTTGPLAGYLIMHFGYGAIFLSASGAAICGCIVLAVLLYRISEHRTREISSQVTSTSWT
jgi:predicted MFS family arabinose efflux permease